MSAKDQNIAKIGKYLKGELDARAMHQLEHEAQDDPFLMDALEGYEIAGKDQEAKLAVLKERLAKRVAPKKERSILLWRILPIAACLLIMLAAGYLFFKPDADKPRYANVTTSEIVNKKPELTKSTESNKIANVAKIKASPNPTKLSPPLMVDKANIKSPTDSVKYIAQNVIKKNVTIDQLLKKMESLDVDKNGNLVAQNKPVTKAKLNGKEFFGGNVKTALKNLPADVLQKIQIIDDYGNQATKNQALTGTQIAQQSPVSRADTANKPGSETVIRGYVKHKPDLANGASYIITGKEVQDNPVGHVEQLLQGKIAGLNIQNNAAAKKKLITITGKVTDKNGMPISGALVSNGTRFANTDTNGRYRIAANIDSTLRVASLGSLSRLVKITPGQTMLDVKLEPEDNRLAEVSIRGYVKRSRDQTTGASYIITGKDKNCKENARFKRRFFKKIVIAEQYISEHAAGDTTSTRSGKFLRTLKFIKKRVRVSFPTDKTAIGYADLKIFGQNKREWLKWYEANKCNNLK